MKNLHNIYYVEKKDKVDIMGRVIFIGGPTACGKSTFTKELNKSITNSICYRRFQGFYDIARLKNLSSSEIFKQVSSEEVDNWFLEICEQNEIVISDVHYAVQLNRDNDDIYQEYVPTISKSLINMMLSNNIEIIVVYLSCSPTECLKRAVKRYEQNEKDLRTKSLEDAKLENLAEEKEWRELAHIDSVYSLNLDSEQNLPEELVQQFLEYYNNLNNSKGKAKVLQKVSEPKN